VTIFRFGVDPDISRRPTNTPKIAVAIDGMKLSVA
jgi:hypothetical protein